MINPNITSKPSFITSLTFGVHSTQGSRPTQQDTFQYTLPDDFVRDGYALYAVYDGHGADGYSDHAKANLGRFLTEDQAFIDGDYIEAMKNAFSKEEEELLLVFGPKVKGGTTATVPVENVAR